jgi:hypothetical protein
MKLPATLAFLAFLSLLACLPMAAPAQTIYRCGTNEYTRIPCPDGRPVEALDTRSAAQRAEARRILAEEDKRGRQMERDRVKQEASIKPAAATSLKPPAAASAASAPKKSAAAPKKPRRKAELDADRDFIAAAPAAAPKASAPR